MIATTMPRLPCLSRISYCPRLSQPYADTKGIKRFTTGRLSPSSTTTSCAEQNSSPSNLSPTTNIKQPSHPRQKSKEHCTEHTDTYPDPDQSPADSNTTHIPSVREILQLIIHALIRRTSPQYYPSSISSPSTIPSIIQSLITIPLLSSQIQTSKSPTSPSSQTPPLPHKPFQPPT